MALSSLRILELSENVAGEYCGKLLADFAAEVIKIEAPGRGSPTRAMEPFGAATERYEASGLFAYLNTNKASVTLDVHTPEGAATLRNLVGRVDAVIDDHAPGWLDSIGLGPAAVAAAYPDLVVCSITPYGLSPLPGREHAEDINVFHASGWGYHTPSAPDPDRPPLKGAGRFLPSYEAGLDAALCTVSALLDRRSGGPGRFIDISKQAVMASRIDYVLGQFVAGDMDVSAKRTALDLWGPAAIFRCRDGYAYLWMSDRTHWAALKQLMGDPEWMQPFPERWLEFENTPERIALCRREVAAWLAQQERESVVAAAQQMGLALVPVNTTADLYANPQYEFRGFFAEVEHPHLGTARYPTAGYKLSETPVRLDRPAPTLGASEGLIEALLGDAAERGAI